jgi:hypothetical protein
MTDAEHVCQHPIYSHNGAPVRCACGHLSAAALVLDDGQRICHDCATEAVVNWIEAVRTAERIMPMIRAARAGADAGLDEHTRQHHCAVCDRHMPADDKLPFGENRFAHATCAMAAEAKRAKTVA